MGFIDFHTIVYNLLFQEKEKKKKKRKEFAVGELYLSILGYRTWLTKCLFPQAIVCIDTDFYLCLCLKVGGMILGVCPILPLKVVRR